jgi:hypothetical protein
MLTVTAARSPLPNRSTTLASTLTATATARPGMFPPIEYFTLTADLNAIIVDYVDVGATPDVQPISATVEFRPRLPVGTIIWIPGQMQGVALAPIKARTDTDGYLKTIQGDIGVQLVANTPILGLGTYDPTTAKGGLVYDVIVTNVIYNKAEQVISPFAFAAPTVGGGTVDLSEVTKLPPKPGL